MVTYVHMVTVLLGDIALDLASAALKIFQLCTVRNRIPAAGEVMTSLKSTGMVV